MDTTKTRRAIARPLLLLIALPLMAVADLGQNTINSPSIPISHCYHWLDEKGSGFLSVKYNFAQKNNGSITFYTTPGTSNGAIAGPGLYCAKSPVGSYGYGDRVIRLDLVDDIVLLNDKTGRKHCGHDGNYYSQSECDKKPWDIKFYSGGGKGKTAWYVIRDPQAIAQWSANSAQVASDLVLNKKFSNAAFQAHADQTLAAMARERAAMGELVVINHKARMNLLKILDDPEEMKQIPPLNLIARTARYSGKDIDEKRKRKVFKEQALRALEDIHLELSDIKEAIKAHSKLPEIFTKAAKEILYRPNLHKNNVVASYLLLREKDPSLLSASELALIWSSIFKSDNILADLPKAGIDTEAEKSAFISQLPAPGTLASLSIQNQYATLALIDQMSDTPARTQAAAPRVEQILETYLDKHGEFFDQAYSALKNPLLHKERILADIFAERSQSSFQNMDPVFTGLALEKHLIGALPADTLDSYKKQLKTLDLPIGSEETYKLLGRFSAGQIQLPSFIDENKYLGMLLKRSLKEQGKFANPTNTFRLILSGFYEHFYNKFAKAKDDASKAALRNQAEAFFLDQALSLGANLAQAYTYPLLQNASYFSIGTDGPAGLRYDIHPLERYLERYGKGDAAFDSMFESLSSLSYDGSYFHFLTYLALEQDDTNALALLDANIDSLTNGQYNKFRQTSEFAISDTEKQAWHNFIFNRHIANAGRNRVKSDFCGLAQKVKDFEKPVTAYADPARARELQNLIADGKNAKCY